MHGQASNPAATARSPLPWWVEGGSLSQTPPRDVHKQTKKVRPRLLGFEEEDLSHCRSEDSQPRSPISKLLGHHATSFNRLEAGSPSENHLHLAQISVQGPKRTRKHKATANQDFWNSSCLGPWNQKAGFLRLCELWGPYYLGLCAYLAASRLRGSVRPRLRFLSCLHLPAALARQDRGLRKEELEASRGGSRLTSLIATFFGCMSKLPEWGYMVNTMVSG